MATRTVANGGGNFNSTGTWVEGAVPTSADDVVFTATSGQLTVNVASSCKSINFTNYTNTFTISNGIFLSVFGNITFVTGFTINTTPNNSGIITAANSTIVSNGVTWPAIFRFGGFTNTLSDDMIIYRMEGNGLSSPVINGNKIYVTNTCFLYNGSIMSGTTEVIFYTGCNTFSVGGTARFYNNFTINTNTTIAITGLVTGGNIIKYISGTVLPAPSIVLDRAGTTFDTSDMTWGSVSIGGALSITLLSNLVFSGLYTSLTPGVTFSGVGKLSPTSTASMTVNGSGWGSTTTFDTSFVVTPIQLVNLTLQGSSTTTFNGIDIRLSGNLAPSGSINGTSTITMNGTGTISGTGTIFNNLILNTSGTTTFSGTVRYNTGTITYTAGTIVTTGSTLLLLGSCTLNTSGMTWNIVSLNAATTLTVSLTSTMRATTLIYNNTSTTTMDGTSGYDVDNLSILSTNVQPHTLKSGLTYSIRNSISAVLTRANLRTPFKASTPGSQAYMNLYPGATCSLGFVNFTDIDASAGRTIRSFGGTFSNTNNITIITDLFTVGS